ncbi:MAG: energy-coupling factor transporter ATPase [Clostridia bacterium]|nr:energy-coupling factor transporter ATPase [Clostridia bacterium]
MGISIQNLTHVYHPGSPFAVDAVHDVDLEISDGEYVCVIGHTGSGKSTLVQHLNGLLRATSADKMEIEGIDLLQKKPDWRALRRRVGMVFQYPEYQLFEQTVFDDIAFGPKNMGVEGDELTAAVRDSMRLVGLPEETEQMSPFELSGGQRRRAAIAGVLSMRPRVLVLDEPIAGLDPTGKQDILRVIDAYHSKTRATIIMISHNMDDIVSVAGRVIVMHEGRKVLDGSPEDVFSDPDRILALGLGLPTVSRIVREMNARGDHIPASVCRKEDLVRFLTEGRA